MTPQEFLDKFATANTDSEKLFVCADYLKTTALDHATTPKWKNLPYSKEIQFALINVGFHLEALGEQSS